VRALKVEEFEASLELEVLSGKNVCIASGVDGVLSKLMNYWISESDTT